MTERKRRAPRGRSGRSHRGGRPKKPSSGPAPEELHPVDEPPPIESFTEWELGEEIQSAIAAMDITTPTPIQRLAIGPVLEGRDVIAKAETGTGKTLAFGAPMMAKIEPGRSTVLGLVLCPTRELAQQVANVIAALGLPRKIGVALVVGGEPIMPQIKSLQSGVQVVVGTPGRVLDLMGQRFLSFPWTEFVVLDEADEMLEIGFLDDIEKILLATPEERQTLLFSATFPPALLTLARKHTREPVELATAKGVSTVDRIDQKVVFMSEEDRPHVLRRLLLDSSPNELFLVFCERRTEVDRLMRRLERLAVGIKALHGGYDQAARFRVMSAFRQGQVRALVATDVASRGLDVSGVTHVINYSPPRDVSDYTHRIGRTGRAGREGCAITFVAPAGRRRWRELTAQMNWEVEEVGERDLAREVLPGLRPRRRERPEARDSERDDTGRDASRRRRRGRDDGGREPRPAREEGRPVRRRRTRTRIEEEQTPGEPNREGRGERERRGDDAPRPIRRRRRRDTAAETAGTEQRDDAPSRDGDEGPRRPRRRRTRSRPDDPSGEQRSTPEPAPSDAAGGRRRGRRDNRDDDPRPPAPRPERPSKPGRRRARGPGAAPSSGPKDRDAGFGAGL